MRAIAAALAYTAFWLATRAPAIAANPLFFDDFAVPPFSSSPRRS